MIALSASSLGSHGKNFYDSEMSILNLVNSNQSRIVINPPIDSAPSGIPFGAKSIGNR